MNKYGILVFVLVSIQVANSENLGIHHDNRALFSELSTSAAVGCPGAVDLRAEMDLRARGIRLFPGIFAEFGSMLTYSEIIGGITLNYSTDESKIFSVRLFYGQAGRLGLFESVGENWRSSGFEVQMKTYFRSNDYSGIEYSAGLSNYRGKGNTTSDYFLPRAHLGWFLMII